MIKVDYLQKIGDRIMETIFAATPKWPTIKSGNKGANVSALQCLLNYHGASISVDGNFCSGTKTALSNYQSRHNLDPDGIASPATLATIVVEVKRGTSNNAAKAAQYLINKFESISIDGAFGAGAETATKIFQQKMGIGVTGVVNSLTWQYLSGYDAYPGSVTGNVYASVCTGKSTLTSAQMTSNAKYIWSYLTQQGFTKNAACGVLGNMQQESGINPGIWQSSNNTSLGYGLVQWTPATVFLNRAVETGVLSATTAATVNNLTNSNPKSLMDAELSCLLWCCTSRGDFFKPTAGGSMDHTGIRLTFAEFKASTLDAGTLAKVFHDHYERSGDGTAVLNQRASYATAWYNRL